MNGRRSLGATSSSACSGLYNRTGDPALLKLAQVLHDQGADWKAHFANFEFREQIDARGAGPEAERGVTPIERCARTASTTRWRSRRAPLWSLVSGRSDRSRRDRIARSTMLDRYHGLPNGMFSADEHYAGQDPSQGTELCAVVEAMFSLQQAIRVTGDAALADRLERIAFNALPATFTADMWAHQYDQQPNQVLCTLARRELVHQRTRVQPLRHRTQLRLLHGEHASRVAEASPEPVDGDARQRARWP